MLRAVSSWGLFISSVFQSGLPFKTHRVSVSIGVV